MSDACIFVCVFTVCYTAYRCTHCVMDFKDDADRRKYEGKYDDKDTE